MSRTLAGASSDHECRINNQHLIDCYLSDQISPRQCHQHLINVHGLHDAWDAHLARHRLSDGTDISRKTVEQITVAQRKLSPIFPTIADARGGPGPPPATLTGGGPP